MKSKLTKTGICLALLCVAVLIVACPAAVALGQSPGDPFPATSTDHGGFVPEPANPTPLPAAIDPPGGKNPDNTSGTTHPPAGNLLSIITSGGPAMIPIAICSFVLLVFVFEKMISLRRGRVIPRHFVRRFMKQLKDGQLERETALVLCEENRSPVASVFAAAVKKWGRTSVEIEQSIIDTGERVTNELRRYLRVINGVATISPLLGLLGTVLGMINAFKAIAAPDAMGQPELLPSHISQALLTTAAGLTVAIPALIAYLFFIGRVDRYIMDIDSLGQEVVQEIASDSWKKAQDKKNQRKNAA